jgi:TonB family protein
MKAPASAATAAATRSVTAYMKEVKLEEQTADRVIKIKVPADSKLAIPPTTNAVKFDPPSIRPNEGGAKTPLVMKPSEDPVLAELERSELEEDTKKSAADKTETADGVKSPVAGERNYGSDLIPPPMQPKRNGMLAGTLMLALAGGGLYAVWDYQPEFRTMAQAQINHLLSLVGVEHAGGGTPKPAKVQAIAVASPSRSEVKSTNDVNQAAATPVYGAAGSAVTGDPSSSAVADKNTSTAAKSQDNADKTLAQPVGKQAVDDKTSETKTSETKSSEIKTSEIKLVESKISTTPSNAKSESASASIEPTVESDSEAVILSSQGAQKRLIYSVPPKYPVDQRPRGAQGTIVLKTDVQASGKVGSVRVVEGNPALATAAVDAVKQWRYRPYLRSGKAQPFQTVVIVDFQRP